MPRAIWKGAISFGLVHVPVALYPASHEDDIDFDWIDRRTMDPVGYKRINKRTGKEIDKDDIVRGVKQENGDYVLLGDDEIRAAYPKTMQTIGIERFVRAQEISFTLLEKPYFLEPDGRADKVYALLREAMLAAGVIGIARVVLHTKEHLAALVAAGPALMLVLLRWASEIRSPDDLQLPPAGKSAASLKESELEMAQQLIGEMTERWKPGDFADRFTDAIHALVARKAAAGETEAVTPFEEAPAAGSSNVVDLTELLKQSLRKGGKAAAKGVAAKATVKGGAAKKAAAKKRA